MFPKMMSKIERSGKEKGRSLTTPPCRIHSLKERDREREERERQRDAVPTA